jgi:hypothetical protein
MHMELDQIDSILNNVFEWSRAESFKGYNKHDALNSPVLKAVLGSGKWPRIVAIQSVMRFPINIRPILGVPKTFNPKGLALFVLGLLDWYKSSGNIEHLQNAEKLISLLLKNRSSGPWSGNCWGYPYPWQDLGFYAPAHTPNAVVTCFVCEAFLAAFRKTNNEEYLEVVEDACLFLLNDLIKLEDTNEGMCFSYMPLPMTMKVLDVSILIGAVLAQFSKLSKTDKHLPTARSLVQFVVNKQTDYGAWFYTDPPHDSPIRHDNYHTGFILDALWRFMEASNDWLFKDNYELGLKFYATELFNPDGSPRWMSHKDYPHDIHGSAQGLVSFSLAVQNGYNYEHLLNSIGTWAINNMYHPQGRFYYQHGRYFKKTFTLLRWCNSWMFRGLGSWLLACGRKQVKKK